MGIFRPSLQHYPGRNYDVNCAYCGRAIGQKETVWQWDTAGGHSQTYYCSQQCCIAADPQTRSPSNSAGGAAGSSGAASGDSALNEGLGMAAAGIGAAAAGIGAAAKGLGALTKGAGSLLGSLGKGVNVVVDSQKAEIGKTHSAEEEITAINKMTFSSDPEEYKKELWALFDRATSKPADPLRDTFVIKAAKKKLIHELDMCKLKNTDLFNSQFAQMYEELNKKKKLFGIFG